jgi:predicted helicase
MRPPLSRRLLRSLAALATNVAVRLEASLTENGEQLAVARASLEGALGREVPAAECADMLSQAIVASLPLVLARKDVFSVASPWLLEQARPWERLVLDEVFGTTSHWLRAAEFQQGLGPESSVPISPCHDLTHLYEHFLAEYRRLHRKRGGVFYTPAEIVRFITKRVHRQLQEEFDIERGLANATIFDPAAGTGAFLLGAIDVVDADFKSTENWNDFVSEQLLPNLHGIEIIPAACIAAQLNIAVKLADTGFDFQQPGRIRVELRNSLADSGSSILQSAIPSRQSPLLLLGNPPFSSLSDNRGKWITSLVHGSQEFPGYIVTADERLGEKKTWLHDDYVKFVRYAQWLIEQAGSGIIGFVTNHGYLDNVTFRLMRRELLRVFSQIDIVDLHGNRKKGETAPENGNDENVFGLDQGIAIGFFRRLPEKMEHTPRNVRHAELWGTRDDKLRRLAELQDLAPSTSIAPTAPNYLFTPAPPPIPPEYASAWRLPEAMPVNTTAPVTARDHFVIGHTREELCSRIAEFRDLSISDDEIRSRYFTRTRSAKYPPGDTRSWKLPTARRLLAAEDNWQSFIRRCLYRPFDWRYVFWHQSMIDWPRSAVVDRLPTEQETGVRSQESGDQFPLSAFRFPLSAVLISRRQMLPTQPCSFFWIADTLALDGVIRSDNRGSESLFPLYLKSVTVDSPSIAANFAAGFIASASHRLRLDWLANGQGDLTSTFGPEDLLHYSYAIFHSPNYRQRYAAELRTDFPRILLPKAKDLFANLVPRGERLVQWHTHRAPAPSLNGVTASQLQEFRVGGHQLLRPGRHGLATTRAELLAPYLAATLHEMAAIDQAIEDLGGFPAAFA